MLSEADRTLVERDRALPGLAVVLDPDAVLALFAGGVDSAVIRGANPTYVRYKPATSCIVGYELSTDVGTVLAYAKAHAPTTAGKLTKALQREVRDERLGVGVVTDDDDGVLVAAATSDRQLPALRVLGDPVGRQRLLRTLLPTRPELWTARPRALRHKPERRWLGVVEHEGRPVALIKAYREADFEPARTRLKLLAAPSGQPLGWSRRRAAVATRWVTGRSLSDLLDANLPVDMGAVGQALAAFHARAPSPRLGGTGPRRARGTLLPAADAIGGLLPSMGPRAERLAGDIARAMRDMPQHRGVVHGDFSADQVIVGDAGADLIDVDQAQLADPAADLASFSADLIRSELEGRLGRGRAVALFTDLLDAYDQAGARPVGPRLAVHRAGALLRLGAAPFRERRSAWPEVCEALLDAAERSLAPGEVTMRRSP